MKTLTFDATLAHADNASTPSSRKTWTGRILAGVPLLFLTWDASVKLLAIPQVVEASGKIGFTRGTLLPLGLVELTTIILVLFQRTRIFGAVLLTAYLGGAVAIHVQRSDPALSHTLFPVYFAILLWSGLALIDARIRAISPFPRR
jgi:hypothetical protein